MDRDSQDKIVMNQLCDDMKCCNALRLTGTIIADEAQVLLAFMSFSAHAPDIRKNRMLCTMMPHDLCVSIPAELDWQSFQRSQIVLLDICVL
jgi:hypothetical protein